MQQRPEASAPGTPCCREIDVQTGRSNTVGLAAPCGAVHVNMFAGRPRRCAVALCWPAPKLASGCADTGGRLPCREKAPFTLCVEVLDEADAAAAAELRAAAHAVAGAQLRAAAQAAAPPVVRHKPAADGDSCADSAKSLLAEAAPAPPLPAVEDGGAAAAAAEAAAIGIPFVANHHRTLSMDTVSTSSSDATALAAVQGSSAVKGDAVAAARALQQPALAAGSRRSSIGSGPTDGQPDGVLASEPSFAGLLQAGGSPAGKQSPGMPAHGGSSLPDSPGLPRPRRLTDELDAVSDVPSFSESGSGLLGSPLTGSGDSPLGLSGLSSPCSVSFEQSSPRQQGAAPAGAAADQQLQQRLTALNLPGTARGKLAGAGTWIRGSMSPPATSHRQAQQQLQQQGSTAVAPMRGSDSASGGTAGAARLQGDVTRSLDRALAGLRGEAPLVSVRLEVLNDRPLSSARSTDSSVADQQHGTPRSVDSASGGSSAAAAAAERRRASLDAARRAPHQCDSSSWACKLGLCKLCNAKLATMGDEEDEPFVRVHFTVQGGVGERGYWVHALCQARCYAVGFVQ